ncbi:LCP family protein [Peribacillus sp. SCS-37]|uniref:LCP family protein n=1 Tax=Paraperibacillus esterisolvens TaxID=3115296 RepID=UPI003905E74B
MESRTRKQKKALKKKVKYFLAVLLTAIISLAAYASYQYYSGRQLSMADHSVKNEDPAAEFNGQESPKGKTNVLLLGVDKREKQNGSNSDTMIIAQYDSDNNLVKMVSLMRDMYVQIPGYEGYKKLNSSYLLGGPELTRQTIKQNFGIDIQYYVSVDFKGFERVVDTLAPEGIEVNVEKAMSKNIGVSLQPGIQKLHGKELLGYARFRHDAQSDFGRVKRQQEVIKLVSNEILSTNGMLKAPKLLGTIHPYIETNISDLKGIGYLKDFLVHRPEITETISLPVAGSFTNERVPVFGDVLKYDETVNSAAIDSFLN